MKPDDRMSEVRLRRFRLEDLQALVRLDRRCFAPDIAYDRFEMICHLSGPRRICLLAFPPLETDPRLFGFVIAVAGQASRSGQIVTIDVAPDQRRRGIGRLLLSAAEDQLAARRNRSVKLQVAVDNRGAQLFYERLGYAPAGRLPGYYPDGTDALELVKRLDRQRTGKQA